MNDEQIIQLFFTRNEDAIRQTDDRYGAKLTRLSENIVGSREDAQERQNILEKYMNFVKRGNKGIRKKLTIKSSIL